MTNTPQKPIAPSGEFALKDLIYSQDGSYEQMTNEEYRQGYNMTGEIETPLGSVPNAQKDNWLNNYFNRHVIYLSEWQDYFDAKIDTMEGLADLSTLEERLATMQTDINSRLKTDFSNIASGGQSVLDQRAKKDLSNCTKPYIIKAVGNNFNEGAWSANTNINAWYRLYSDKWIEVGARYCCQNGNRANYTIPIPFVTMRNTSYNVMAIPTDIEPGYNGNYQNTSKNVNGAEIGFGGLTTISFKLGINSGYGSNQVIDWSVRGYVSDTSFQQLTGS